MELFQKAWFKTVNRCHFWNSRIPEFLYFQNSCLIQDCELMSRNVTDKITFTVMISATCKEIKWTVKATMRTWGSLHHVNINWRILVISSSSTFSKSLALDKGNKWIRRASSVVIYFMCKFLLLDHKKQQEHRGTFILIVIFV